MISLEDVEQAQKAIVPYINATPLLKSGFLSELTGGEVFLKLENQQVTRSFKIRGVMNKLLTLTADEKAKAVVTASAGNHGQAVAYGSQKLGFSAQIVVPVNTPKVKVDG
jgi:threonine dehydratase